MHCQPTARQPMTLPRERGGQERSWNAAGRSATLDVVYLCAGSL